ncbi:MAG: hypothetical protein LBT32_09695 [Peptococcaceae bacterium]|nr:hypothetical protein [Peptococcaceae bacterium]
MTKQRILIISASGLIIFCLFISGQILYKNYWQERGYNRQTESIPGVRAVQVVTVNNAKVLRVSLHGVTDLRAVCWRLQDVAGVLPIQFLDQRNVALEEIWRKMQFAVQEGIAQGNFSDMAQEVRRIGLEAGCEVYLTMDQEGVYLLLSEQGAEDAQGAQLVDVISRQADGRYLPSQGGGPL